MSKAAISYDGTRTETVGRWVFIGENGPKGFKKNKVYKLKVFVNHDPHDFFIYAHPIKLWHPNGVFYSSHKLFEENWEHQEV